MSDKTQITLPPSPRIDIEIVPLHEAINEFKKLIKNDNSNALRKLLDKRDDIDVNLNNGFPLLYAIENNCFKVFKVLVKHPDINLDIKNSLPLLTALQDERYECFKYLLRYGASLTNNVTGILETVKMCCDGRFRASLERYNFHHFYVKYPSY
jgi:ankyrin repeat protein